MTKQEYYNLLVNCASNGTFPSVHEEEKLCRYRLDNTKKCAVGILISDQDYYPALEGRTVYNLPNEILEKIMPKGMHVSDLRDIQQAHDNLASNWDSSNFILALNNIWCFHDVVR